LIQLMRHDAFRESLIEDDLSGEEFFQFRAALVVLKKSGIPRDGPGRSIAVRTLQGQHSIRNGDREDIFLFDPPRGFTLSRNGPGLILPNADAQVTCGVVDKASIRAGGFHVSSAFCRPRRRTPRIFDRENRIPPASNPCSTSTPLRTLNKES